MTSSVERQGVRRVEVPRTLVLDTLLKSRFLDQAWQPADEVEVWAAGPVDHAEPPCLAALAAWAEWMRARGSQIRVHDSLKSPYTWRLGLLSLLVGERASPGMLNYLPPTLVRSKAEMTRLLDEAASVLGLTALGERGSFQQVLSEALRNVFEHSEAAGGVVCASFFPKNNRLTISIVDTGIGVPSAMRGRWGAQLSDGEANKLAVEFMVTGSAPPRGAAASRGPDDNFGFGLFVMRAIASRSRGMFTLLSHATFVQGTDHTDDVSVEAAGVFWPGTVVTVTMDASRGEEAWKSINEALSTGLTPNRKTQPVAWGAAPQEGAGTAMFEPVGGTIVEDKDLAKRVREEQLLPAMQRGEFFTIDLRGASLVSHSFAHALFYKAIVLHGDVTPRLLYVQATTKQVKDAVRLIGHHALLVRTKEVGGTDPSADDER